MSKIYSIPTNLEEAFVQLNDLLTMEDKQYLEHHPKEAPVRLRHSLGRYLRNNWGFWDTSSFKVYLQESHGIYHPDDMFHFVIEQYIQFTVLKNKNKDKVEAT